MLRSQFSFKCQNFFNLLYLQSTCQTWRLTYICFTLTRHNAASEKVPCSDFFKVNFLGFLVSELLTTFVLLMTRTPHSFNCHPPTQSNNDIFKLPGKVDATAEPNALLLRCSTRILTWHAADAPMLRLSQRDIRLACVANNMAIFIELSIQKPHTNTSKHLSEAVRNCTPFRVTPAVLS